MANEAAITIIGRMQDDISPKMQNVAATTQRASFDMQQFQIGLTAAGSALTAVGSLLNQTNNEGLKSIAMWFTIAGAISSTTSAILVAIPYIGNLISSLRNLAIAQSLVQALSGPSGWVTLGVGAAIGGATAYGIARATETKSSGTTVNNYIQGSVVTERQINTSTRQSIIQTGARNGTNGIQ